nr:hypothetical protein [uncultured bacterium]
MEFITSGRLIVTMVRCPSFSTVQNSRCVMAMVCLFQWL